MKKNRANSNTSYNKFHNSKSNPSSSACLDIQDTNQEPTDVKLNDDDGTFPGDMKNKLQTNLSNFEEIPLSMNDQDIDNGNPNSSSAVIFLDV